VFKIRCETCTRLIADAPVKEEGHQFCVDGCRDSWKRVMRRYRTEQQKPLAVGNP
jgi:hypothetical protein